MGEKSYTIQKEVIEDIAVTNKLKRHIYKKGKVLKYINKFNKKTNKIKLVAQQIWEAKDLNIKSTPTQMLVVYKLVYKIQITLQTQYKRTGAVLNYNAIKLYIKIKYNNYPDFKYFIIIFKKAIKKLANLNISLPKLQHPILFIIALSNAQPI